MKTIFIGLEFFSHFSDVLRSKLLEELARSYRLVVLTRVIDSELAQNERYFIHPNVSYRKISIAYPRLWLLFDKYLRHAFIREYDDWFVTKWWYYKPTHPFLIRLLTKIGSFFPRRFPGTSFFTSIECWLARPTQSIRALFKEYSPALLITATPGFTPFEAELICFAKTLGVPSAAIALNVDNPTGKAKFLRRTDYIVVWNDNMREEVVAINHYRRDCVVVAGCLRFDHYFNDQIEGKLKSREKFLLSKRLDPQKKTIVYATSTPIAYPPRKEFMEVLYGLKEKGTLRGDPNILVRLHPHDVFLPYEVFEKKQGVRIERAGEQRVADTSTKGQKVEMEEEDLANLTETLLYSDVVINYSSTTTTEACIFGKPIIGIGFPADRKVIYEYEMNQEQVRMGVMEVAEDEEQLGKLLNKYLEAPEINADGRKAYAQKHVQFMDGRTWKRVADFVKDHV